MSFYEKEKWENFRSFLVSGIIYMVSKTFFCILLTYISSSILPKCTKSVLFSLHRITPVSICFPILWLYECIIFHGKIKCVCFSSPHASNFSEYMRSWLIYPRIKYDSRNGTGTPSPSLCFTKCSQV